MTVTHAQAVTPTVDEALAPLRDELLDAARREAEATTTEAEHQATALLARASADAERMRAEARAEGERDAEVIRRDQVARARRRARGVVLAAQNDALARLRRAVDQRIRAAWEDPRGHDVLLARLTELAHAELGGDCAVHEHPDGGIVAERAAERVRLVLSDLAQDVIDERFDAIERLWPP